MALISLGLMTAVQPAATAVASFPAIKPLLAFHGMMMPTTPSGVNCTSEKPIFFVKSNFSKVAIAAVNPLSVNSMLILQNCKVPPYSSTITSTSSSFRLDTASCIRFKYSIRSAFVV
ncbi:hypothetical protein D9M72_353380 [compost metagenome]